MVFKEKGFEHLGFQVPGGTVEKNEDLLEALKREVEEESGITELRNFRFLGEYSYRSEKSQSGIKRYYYQLEATCPESFTHIVQSNDEDDGWIYMYSWIDLDEKPTLFSYLGVHLEKIG